MSVVIIDYGSGNLRSAQKAFDFAAREAELPDAVVVTSDPSRIARAERIVLPGVGAFADCFRSLSSTSGMLEALNEAVIERGAPMFGICVGMQLFATRGLEHTVSEGLDWIPGDVRALEPGAPCYKIPHMGWNVLDVVNEHPLLEGVDTGPDGWHAYFVHSYAHAPETEEHVVARSKHGVPFTAIVGRDNIVGTQFHPEKSQRLGLAMISNFLRWRP